MTFVKFCGITRECDVEAACDVGVQAVGFVLWAKSPRFVTADRVASLIHVLSPGVLPVGVLVRPSNGEIEAAITAGVRVLQIHGADPAAAATHASPIERWLAASVHANLAAVPPQTTILLDADDPVRQGGTGRMIDWMKAAHIAGRHRVLLAGGLTPANVASAIQQVRPFGVDVSSGIEERPGVKDTHAMKAFIAAVREAEQ